MNSVTGIAGIASLTGPTIAKPADPAKIQAAAQQFEALLIGQMLHSAHDADGGWLGSGDSASSCATDYAEEQLAATIARQGGLGLSKLIVQGLEKESSRGAANPGGSRLLAGLPDS